MELSSCIFLPLLTAMLTKINEYIKNSTNIHHVWLKKFYTFFHLYLTRITNSLLTEKMKWHKVKREHIKFYCLNYFKYNGMINFFPSFSFNLGIWGEYFFRSTTEISTQGNYYFVLFLPLPISFHYISIAITCQTLL